MPANPICPACGVVLPADAPRGLCPRCLVLTAAGDFLGGPAGSPKAEPPLVHYFGDYELLEEIARGGMGVVYRARQVSLNRPVAVKMILAGLFANDAERKRFKVEAETAARLNHPNIVEIYEVGEHEGQSYFSMRLVEGASLAERVRSAECRVSSVAEAEVSERRPAPKPLSIVQSVRLMAKASRAVHFAHQRGVLHRDLKPGNILLDGQGEPHITDFGLARLIEGDSDLTLSGAVLGSPAYMPPEQAAGRANRLTTAADVYGLGAVLYFLLAGQPPYAGATPVETVRRVLDEEPPNPRRFNPRLDSDLETICLKCLEKDPQRRYGSAEALAEDLERWLRHEPILARPVGTFHRFGKWVRRKPQVAALVGVIALSLAFGVASVFYEWRQAEVARRNAEKHSLRAENAQKDAVEKLRDAYLAQAHANRLTAEPGRRFASLAILAKAAAIRPGPDLRDEAIACLALEDVRRLKAVEGPPGAVASSQPDDAWERYAAALPSGEVSVCRLSDDQELLRLPSAGSTVDAIPGFSHSSKWLAVRCRDGKGRVWDLNQRMVVLTAAMASGSRSLDFRAGDEQLAVVDDQGTVRLFETATGSLIRRFEANPRNPCLAYSVDGRFLAAADTEGALKVYEADTGALLSTLRHPGELPHPAIPLGLAWHPDNRRLATAGSDRQVRIWDVPGAKELQLLAGHGEEVRGVAFHPGGELLMSAGFDGAMLWEVQTGRRLFMLPEWRFNPKFAPSGDRFYTKQISLAGFDLWEINTAVPVRSLGSKAALFSVKAVTFSGDGRLLAFADGRCLHCFDPRQGRELGQVAFGEAHWLQFDAHGQLWTASPVWGNGRALRRCYALREGAAPGEWTLSANEPMSEPAATGPGALTRDGVFLVTPYAECCRVIETGTGREVARTTGRFPAAYCAWSPDRRWLAVGAHRYGQVRLWEWAPGQTNLQEPTVLHGPASWGGWPEFSPDGLRLAVHWGAHLAVYDTSQWRQLWIHPVEDQPFLAQAPDGRLLALRTDKRRIHLLAPGDGTVLATLEMPNGMPVAAMAFSPDSTLLVAASAGTRELFVWDLPALHAALTRLGLDWGLPSAAESHSAANSAHR